MSSAEQTSELRFEPPGPGSCEQDPVHFPRPLTRYWTEVHPGRVRRGHGRLRAVLRDADRRARESRTSTASPTSTMLPAPEEEIPQRFARAEEVFAGKLWREQLREWDETSKPAAIAKHRELQAVDPDALSDEELVAYLGRCRDHHSAMITQHMRYTASAVVPTGDFLAHVGDWTGLPPSELLGLMRGASPVSAGASAELERLIAAIRAGPGRPGAARVGRRSRRARLERCARSTARRARRCPAYLDLVGYRLLDGFDISEPLRARAAGPAAAGDPNAVETRGRGDGRRGRDRRRPRARSRRSTGTSSTSCSARRGCSTGSATSAASTATSGRRGSCAGPRSRPAAGSPPRAASTSPSTSSTPASTRCARWSRARAARRRTSSPHGPSTAPAHSAKDAPATLGPPPPPPPDPTRAAAGGRPADARDGHRAGRAVRQLGGGARGAPAARPRGEPRRLRRDGAARLRAGRVRPDRPGRRPRHRCRRPRRSTSCCRCSARS